MTEMIKTGSKLALICAVAALCLGAVNMVTEPQIAKFRAAKLKAALEQVAPAGTIGDETAADDVIVTSYYPVQDGTSMSGYILNLKGTGYGGDLIILASFTPEGAVIGSVLMEHDETPGLGKEAENDWYMEKYLGYSGTEIPTSKTQLEQADLDAISGATITYAGIGYALAAGSDFTVKLGGK
ncbi:MAG TPA: FMN-binding protein [Spirochaeta sp.]|nr:FMN-binding protein [Spirochaeta sp.]